MTTQLANGSFPKLCTSEVNANHDLLSDDRIKEKHKNDLPLSSNFDDVQVEHFILDLSCSFERKVCDGVITLFCKFAPCPIDSATRNREYTATCENLSSENIKKRDLTVRRNNKLICLDCFALDITSCNFQLVPANCSLFISNDGQTSGEKSLQIPEEHMNSYLDIYKSLQNSTKHKPVSVDYEVCEHCLKIFLPHDFDDKTIIALKICYRTWEKGPSLAWTKDQNGSPCVFTVGHMLNNRSLMPCQDLPHALSTWHCSVTLLDHCTDSVSVVMTGEREPVIFLNENGQTVFNFFSSYPMPASTFALAVGSWKVTKIIDPTSLCSDKCAVPHCRLFSPESLHEQSVQQFSRYLQHCFEALNCILGSYPLKHLDILIVPECFDSLGLACPHLLLLSQSVLSPDLSMFARVSHELCHTWFGILTGPQDWTEEWLTEGVCCFLEDIIHGLAMKWNEEELQERSTLRALLKFRLLAAEVSNTPEDLQMLRPNEGSLSSTEVVKDKHLFVKNGLNQEKIVMQVHYLKGFFLLKYLEDIAGTEDFLGALKRFVSQHLGQLFSSKELLDYFFENCPKLSTSGLTVNQICQDWLDCPGMPNHLKSFPSAVENHLITEVEREVTKIKAAVSRKRTSGHCPGSRAEDIHIKKLLPDQVVLLLEILIEQEVVVTNTQLRTLRETLSIEKANAEIKHSWCELVVHRKSTKFMQDMEAFLHQHQALGVYLYGELLISGNRRLRNLAYGCFSQTQADMPEGTRNMVHDMLYPS